jgi:RNA polymerase sigma factor (sigma-70 family)
MTDISDKQILTGLRSSSTQTANQALRKLYYREYSTISRLVLNNNGNQEDVADLFQDAIIVLYEKVRVDSFELQSSLRTYLYAISKRLWLNKLRSRKQHLSIEDNNVDQISIPPSVMEVLVKDEQSEIIAQLLEQVGNDCKEILSLYYFKRLRMKEIADVLGLAQEQGAKNKKSRCLKKLRQLVFSSEHLLK